MSDPHKDDSARPFEFTGDDLDLILKAHEKTFDMAEHIERRVVVEVWDASDTRPVAWLEVHPTDSNVTIRFEKPREADDE